MNKVKMSVANSIKALALININDIFRFTITATDDEIRERYSSEEDAVNVAEKYLDIALKAGMLEMPIKGWSMTYTMPEKDSDKRNEYKAYFYDVEEADERIISDSFDELEKEEAQKLGLGERIKQKLDELGMSQRELAQAVKITEVSMSRYINNDRTPKGPIISQIARVLGVTSDWLLGLSDKMEGAD